MSPTEHPMDSEGAVAAAIDAAEEFSEDLAPDVTAAKPRLLVDNCNPDLTIMALRNILADAGELYDRGGPVRLAFDEIQKGTVAQPLTPYALVMVTHRVCRPYALKIKGGAITEVNARLPYSFAVIISTGAAGGDCHP